MNLATDESLIDLFEINKAKMSICAICKVIGETNNVPEFLKVLWQKNSEPDI